MPMIYSPRLGLKTLCSAIPWCLEPFGIFSKWQYIDWPVYISVLSLCDEFGDPFLKIHIPCTSIDYRRRASPSWFLDILLLNAPFCIQVRSFSMWYSVSFLNFFGWEPSFCPGAILSEPLDSKSWSQWIRGDIEPEEPFRSRSHRIRGAILSEKPLDSRSPRSREATALETPFHSGSHCVRTYFLFQKPLCVPKGVDHYSILVGQRKYKARIEAAVPRWNFGFSHRNSNHRICLWECVRIGTMASPARVCYRSQCMILAMRTSLLEISIGIRRWCLR